MKILLVDILRSGLEEIWPAAEHSVGLMYLSSVLKKRFGNRINITIWSLISIPNHTEEDKDNMLKIYQAQFEVIEHFIVRSGKDNRIQVALNFIPPDQKSCQ